MLQGELKIRKRAFTFVEIMIVILILGIISAIAIPNFVRARARSEASSCISNLAAIESAKEQWALDNRKVATDEPLEVELVPDYIKEIPVCPSGGNYTINKVRTRPSCTISGHAQTN